MISFYGGKPGQDFSLAAVFPNKVAMDNDLAKKYNSEIPMNSFVIISYGKKNEQAKSDYVTNRDIDMEAYGHAYDSTLWYKIYNEADVTSTDDLTRYGIHYELIADLAGQTPVISFTKKSEELNPVDAPFITIEDLSDSNFPVLKAHLPRAVNWYSGSALVNRTSGQTITDKTVTYYKGDIYFNNYNGNVFKCTSKSNSNGTSTWSYIGNILGPTLDVRNVTTTTLNSRGSASVAITQSADSNGVLLPTIDFAFKIPRGARIFSGQGTYDASGNLTSTPFDSSALNGDFFLEGNVSGKIGTIYERGGTSWNYRTSIFGKTPQITANSKAVNPDYALKVKVNYAASDTAHNNPTLTFDIPRGSKWFAQDTAPVINANNITAGAAGDFWFNTKDGYIYQCANGNWNTKVGTFIVNLTNTSTVGLNPYVVSGSNVTATTPKLEVIVDSSNPAIKPKVKASLPKAPIITIDQSVGVLDPSSQKGTASISYSAEGVKFKFDLPRGIQGEMGKGLNIRRSYNSIADRDANAEGLTWKDSEACTVKTSADSEYYDVYIYQSDYPGKWVYTGTLLISSIDDTKVSSDYAWSSQKIQNELNVVNTNITDLSDSVDQSIQELNNSINQDISQQMSELNTEITKVKTALSSSFTWGQLKSGKTIQ